MIRPKVEKLLLVLGLAGIGFWAWSQFRTSLFQRQASVAFDHSIENSLPAPRQMAAVKNGDLIGRLSIPRLKLAAMVREGDGGRSLDVALGHIPGTALPGEPGNTAVAGHRDTLFRGLGRVSTNDLIRFQTLHGTYSYRVESTAIVKPADVEVLKPAGYSEITLVTCYPFHYIGSAPDRFIVKARLVPTVVDVAATAPAPKPASHSLPRPGPIPQPRHAARPAAARVAFHVSEGHSCRLASGVELGLSSADSSRQRVNAWLSITPRGQTIFLRNQSTDSPIVFRGSDGRIRQLILTSVAGAAASGYVVDPGW